MAFDALAVALYEDGEDRPFLKDFFALVSEAAVSGHFKMSVVARLAYYAIVSSYRTNKEALPDGLTPMVLLEKLVREPDFELASAIVNGMADCTPVAKNAESPEVTTTTEKDQPGKK